MELNEIWNSFAERMAEIELFERAAQASAKKELTFIGELSNSLKDIPELKDVPSSVHNMTFHDARTGQMQSYSYKEQSVEDRYLRVLLHKNKQYQWLLAEAYEEFEDLLENLYAYCGYVNNEFWPLRDYGNISLPELGKKDYVWYVEQARKKKDVPYSILNKFRDHFPALKVHEARNQLKVNLSLAITLTEKLRHIIVHKRGSVSSKEKFIKVTMEQAGLYNNGKIAQEHLNFIDQFFGSKERENLITLLEIEIPTGTPVAISLSRFGKLTGYLLGYANLLCDCIASGIRDNRTA